MYITLYHVSFDHRTHTYLLTCEKQLCKGAVGRDCPSAIMVLMPVNQVDTAFEYAVIFVCWIMCRVNQERNYYMIMLLNIVVDHLRHISTYTHFT